MTTPAWLAKVHHELVVFVARLGRRLTPAEQDELRALLARSIGARVLQPSDDDDTPTDPGFKHPPKPARRVWP